MTPPYDLTLVSGMQLAEPDVDEQPLLDALHERGVRARVCSWDDATVDWAAAPLTVLRSPWNYVDDRQGFLRWAREISMQSVLRNPLATIQANTHKSYLAALERSGIEVVPTHWLSRRTDAVTQQDVAGSLPWRHVVVKPAVGAGSLGVRRFDLDADPAAANEHVRRLQHAGEVLVQPWIDQVETEGERCIVWIAGEFTHAVRKTPRLAGDDEAVSGPVPIADDELALARRALATVPALATRQLLYARVDMVRDELGTPRLVELELTEPSLFLTQHPPALDRFADALARDSGAVARVTR